jgi:hypothetical protein
MRITTGDNTVRVAGFHKVPSGIYDQYQFNFINQAGYTHAIGYNVPAGVIPPRIVRDLLELRRRKLWFVIYLREKNRMLMIHTIKEPKVPQAELWHFAKGVVA